MKMAGFFYFTIMELLIVISVIIILCSLLLPALSKAKHKVEGTVCASNCRQISLALNQYSGDFNDWLLPSALPYIAFASGIPKDNLPWFEALGKFGPYSQLDYGIRICSLGNSYYDEKNTYYPTGARIICPSQKVNNLYEYSDYAINFRLFGLMPETYPTHKITQITQPSIAKAVFDNGRTNKYGISYTTNTANGDIYVGLRHDQKTNILYADGHISGKNFQDLTSLGNHGGATELLEGF